jgi:hypothetical protein
LAEEMHE